LGLNHIIEEYLPLAPVHNSLYLSVISIFQKLISDIPMVALLETSFHRDIPPEAFLYAVPFSFYEKHGIRKYGFHGASHRYISEYAVQKYGNGKKDLKIIYCHLGGSSSICAIRNGKSIDTSMGMSPQSGLMNSNRVGDFAPYALLYLMEKENFSIDETRNLLGSKSGVYGISGLSGDFRDIEKAMDLGNERALHAQ
jgi:acetate kinase